jgi:spore maturation protein CgeB
VWDGIDTLFVPGQEIALARDSADVLDVLVHWPRNRGGVLAKAARQRVLEAHTAFHRARELEGFLLRATAASSKWRSAQIAAPATSVKRPILSAG